MRGVDDSDLVAPLSEEDAEPDGFRARFFQCFHLAHADKSGKFRAVADYGLGGRGAMLDCGGDDIGSSFF